MVLFVMDAPGGDVCRLARSDTYQAPPRLISWNFMQASFSFGHVNPNEVTYFCGLKSGLCYNGRKATRSLANTLTTPIRD
ncbi:unnamed protein product [Absidia cylindrospora]